MEILTASEFVDRSSIIPILDVRSPLEFKKGHFPGAENIPLLDDEVRRQVGIAYKQKSRSEAVRLAFELTGSHFHEFISEAEKKFPQKKIGIYCWRGGLRSNTMAWILGLAGFQICLLKGGYKAFRNWSLQQFKIPKKIIVLGGRTGSGKTDVLEFIKKAGHQVIDLEGLAHHKGSAFGALGQLPQPTNEYFENLLAIEWNKQDSNQFIWLENESLQVGSNIIPLSIYGLMRLAPVIEMRVSVEERSKRILKDYGIFSEEELATNTSKLRKRLGIERTQHALDFLKVNDKIKWLEIVLAYYDKTYDYGMSKRVNDSVFTMELKSGEAESNASQILDFFNSNMKELNLAMKDAMEKHLLNPVS